MRNLLALLGAVIVAFAVVGWYLKWYSVESDPTHAGHTVHIGIDKEKIGKDLNKGGEKLQNAIDKARTEDGKRDEKVKLAVEERPIK